MSLPRSRRELVACVLAFVAVAPAACSKSSAGGPADTSDADARPPTPAEWDRAVTRTDEATAKSRRDACTFARGAMPAETLGSSVAVDKDIPIETVIVLMQENRSFDSYFGHLGKYAGRSDIESAPDATTNPEKTGTPGSPTHPYQHAPHLCELDTNHEWRGSHEQYDDGKMDGFFQTNQGWAGESIKNPTPDLMSGERALWWYDERDIPFYYELAKTFAIADHYHASLLGPTWPNRMYLYCATSFGKTSNVFPDLTPFPFPDDDASIFDELEKRHIDWNVYTHDSPGLAVVYATAIVSRWGRNPILDHAQFYADLAAGKLPPVVFVDAPGLGKETADGADEHPPGDIQQGQKFVSDVVHALMTSPLWRKSVLFLTYDEHGGLYDHVPPPAACPPDATPPALEGKDVGVAGGFDRLGVRVPLVVVSPFAKRGYVSHTTYDHTSVTRFIEAKFKVPALSARDANADALMDMFDFANPPFLDAPPLPQANVDAAELSYCTQTFVTNGP